MEGKGDKIESKQVFKRDRTLLNINILQDTKVLEAALRDAEVSQKDFLQRLFPSVKATEGEKHCDLLEDNVFLLLLPLCWEIVFAKSPFVIPLHHRGRPHVHLYPAEIVFCCIAA